jgi:methylglyoxal synthase
MIALIAHDGKKDDIAELARRHEAALANVPLVATSTTGGVIERAAGSLRPHKVLSGPQGGDLQIGAMIAEDVFGPSSFYATTWSRTRTSRTSRP